MAKLHLAVAEPGTGAGNDLLLGAQIEDVAFVADAVLVHHVKLGDAERWSHLVLDDLGANALADDFFAIFELTNTTDIDAAGAVEFQGPATRGRFGAAEHHSDLLTDLVDEDNRRLALGNCTGELAHRLAHQPCLQADV